MRKLNFLFKTVLLLCALVGSVSAWATDPTITLTQANLELTGSYTSGTEKEVGGITFVYTDLMKSNSNIQAKASSGVIYNKTAFPSKIKSVAITHSGTARSTTIWGSPNGKDWTSIETGNGSITGDFTGGSYYYFKITRASNAAYWTQVVITYEATHTLTYSSDNGTISGVSYGTTTAVTSGASVAEGGKVTLTATPASGYAFTGWSVEGTGSSLSSTSTNPTTFTMGTANATVTANFEVSSTVANPTFSVIAGTYSENQSVELNCPTDGATIYYTTDGTDPTTSSTEYAGAISVTKTTTIKAIAIKDGLTDSGIASATYTLKCATPTITVPSGVFLDSKVITMTSSDGASIYYTTDESTPTSTSIAYDPANKPSISATTTIKAIATKSGWSDSEVATETFTKIVPKTVAEALTAIAALANNGTIADQYVRGVVSTTGSVSSGSVTYYISADGTTTSELQVYKGKGLNGADFTAETNLEAGDEVVVFGTLKNYNGTTPEFDSGSQVINRVTKTAPTFTLDITSKTLDAYTKESVDVTLTTNTDGIIGCESDDEDVATVVKKSDGVYTITAKTEGTATITIYSTATATYKQASATVEITVEDERADAGISFAKDEEEITWGDTYTTQTLTNTNSVVVAWSSTDEAVATVDPATGAITVLKAGETDIKAAFAGSATYKAAVASYTLTVNKANAGLSYTTTSFDIMLNDNSFEAPTLNNPNNLTGITYASNNTTVALVDENDGVLAYDETTEGTAKITASFAGNDWYKAGSANYTINIIDPTVKGSKYNPYTVAEVINGTATGSGIYVTGYIVGNYNSTSPVNPATADTNLALADASNETTGSKTIPVELPKGTLRTNWGPSSKNVIGYMVLLKGNKDTYFSVNGIKSTSEVSAVSVPASLNASGYATFASTNALDFSDDSEFSAWQITDVTSSEITFTQITGKVAAGTGILLKGTASATINIPVAATGTDISATNKLEGVTAAKAVTAGNYFGLSGNKFVPVAAGNVPAGKALLPASAIPTTARELKFVFEGETTGIAEMKNKIADGKYYNLNGQRVENLKKGGLYIMNGKKVVIK